MDIIHKEISKENRRIQARGNAIQRLNGSVLPPQCKRVQQLKLSHLRK